MSIRIGTCGLDRREVGCHEHISADCRVWAAVELRAELPGRAGWVGGVAVPAAPGFPECVRGAAGPGRRYLPVRSQQRAGAAAAAVCAGDDGARDDVADADRVDDGA